MRELSGHALIVFDCLKRHTISAISNRKKQSLVAWEAQKQCCVKMEPTLACSFRGVTAVHEMSRSTVNPFSPHWLTLAVVPFASDRGAHSVSAKEVAIALGVEATSCPKGPFSRRGTTGCHPKKGRNRTRQGWSGELTFVSFNFGAAITGGNHRESIIAVHSQPEMGEKRKEKELAGRFFTRLGLQV